jgi:hypothetical protein
MAMAGKAIWGLSPGSIYQVPFADICTAVDAFIQTEDSRAKYGGKRERNVHVP